MTTTLQSAPAQVATRARAPIAPVPLARLVKIELRKMFDTRSGFWLMAGIAITALCATAAVLMWGSDSQVSQ